MKLLGEIWKLRQTKEGQFSLNEQGSAGACKRKKYVLSCRCAGFKSELEERGS